MTQDEIIEMARDAGLRIDGKRRRSEEHIFLLVLVSLVICLMRQLLRKEKPVQRCVNR
jgi:hypothetical protein